MTCQGSAVSPSDKAKGVDVRAEEQVVQVNEGHESDNVNVDAAESERSDELAEDPPLKGRTGTQTSSRARFAATARPRR